MDTIIRHAYKAYRRLKAHFIENPDSMLAIYFFRLLKVVEKLTSSRKKNRKAAIGKKTLKSINNTAPLLKVITEHPVAADSSDHKWPHGSVHDNSLNNKFNLKLYQYFNYRPDLRVLDIGCAGGAFVKSILENGYTAIGLEGSDISQKLQSGEWGTIPFHLFTCDITYPFKIIDPEGKQIRFHCITAWEVLEHIPEERIGALLRNICENLELDGIFVGSVSLFPDADPITGAVYHVTLREKSWWIGKFAESGLLEIPEHIFEIEDYVRGHGKGLKDWDPRDGDGFHVVMKVKK